LAAFSPGAPIRGPASRLVCAWPDKLGRSEVLALYLKRHKIAANVSAEEIAALTPGFAGNGVIGPSSPCDVCFAII
jgi:hypothetical protein